MDLHLFSGGAWSLVLHWFGFILPACLQLIPFPGTPPDCLFYKLVVPCLDRAAAGGGGAELTRAENQWENILRPYVEFCPTCKSEPKSVGREKKIL